VRGKAGAHEIDERVAAGADAIEVRIPPSWLTPGDYVVTLRAADAPLASAKTADGDRSGSDVALGFSVLAPTAATR